MINSLTNREKEINSAIGKYSETKSDDFQREFLIKYYY